MNARTTLLATAIVTAGLALAAGGANAQGHGGRPWDQGGDDGPNAYDRYQPSDRYQSNSGGYDDRYRYGSPDQYYRSGPQYGGSDQYGRSSYGQGQGYGQGQSAGQGAAMPGSDDRGVLVLLIERDRQVQALRDVREQIRQAQQALQSGDRSKAEQALNQADQTIRTATRSPDAGPNPPNQQTTGQGATPQGAPGTSTGSLGGSTATPAQK